jgi:integrase
MKAKLTNRTVALLKPQERSYDVRDTNIKGFLIRVRPTGSMSYLLQYRNTAGLQKHYKIGSVGSITPVQARDLAEMKAGEVAMGTDIQEQKQVQRIEGERSRHNKLGGFFEHKYLPWVKEHRRNAAETEQRIRRNFEFLFDRMLADVNSWVIEKWRSDRLKAGVSKETINRDIAALKATISKAVDWEIIPYHPLTKVKPLKLDTKGRVRYLSDKEEQALRTALNNRDIKIKSGRLSANEWRKQRGYDPLPNLTDCIYADHLTPIVLLAMNTGLRRGELFNLQWEDINHNTKFLTVQGATAKSGETRHIPLNSEAVELLKNWKKQNKGQERVFYGKDGTRLDNVKKAWTGIVTNAGIKNFRFHDLRHSFASKLVMKGVSLNTVRELLGHADLKTTLRYAHLAPDHKADAVALLNS